MSTTTTNYGLVKPELTDAADITAMNPNWDKIDQELNKKYGTDNKPTASDVGALAHYSSLGSFGLSNSDMSSTDLAVNLGKIVNAKSGMYKVDFEGFSDYNNFFSSVAYKLEQDIGIPTGSSYLIHIEFVRRSNSAGTTPIWITINNVAYTSGLYVAMLMDANYLSDVIRVADASKFLPLDGSVPMSGELQIINGFAKFGATGDRVEITSKYDDSNSGRIVIGNPKNAEKLVNLLKYIFKKDNVENGYRIFGEHNKTSGSYTGNGSATSRTIDTGGVGNAILIWSSNGYMSLCSVYGGFGRTANVTAQALSANIVKFENGILTLTTDNVALNANGVTYYYQVL